MLAEFGLGWGNRDLVCRGLVFRERWEEEGRFHGENAFPLFIRFIHTHRGSLAPELSYSLIFLFAFFKSRTRTGTRIT